jgi:hypothetical protein
MTIQRQLNFSLFVLLVSVAFILNHRQFCHGASVDGREYSAQQSNPLADSFTALDIGSHTLSVSGDTRSGRVKRHRNPDTCDRWGRRVWLEDRNGIRIDGRRNSRAENCRLACEIDGCPMSLQ